MVTLLALSLSCTDSPSTPSEQTVQVPQMSAAELLTRTSLDLRGRRPSAAELDAVRADPAALDGLIDGYLADPAFGDRMADLWSEVYLTRTESFYISAADYGMEDDAGFRAAVGDEPLRILARVADQDLPWTELVTGDWTMADELLAAAWPLEREGGEGWQVARYTDGRPAAGVLATNGLWWRYTSTDSNANRGRANQVSRILLCNDYLVRPIDFERNVDLLDEEAVLDAITNNEGCIACHTSLDPLASYLFGFWTYVPDSVVDASRYHPEREQLWQQYTGVAPGYYGAPGSSLSDLGGQIAADPRFPECAVQQAFELLLRRDATVADMDRLAGHRAAFLDGDLTLRSLVRSVLSDPWYRAGATDLEGAVPRKLMTPDLLADQVAALTGFRWEYAGIDMMSTDSVGLRTLAGGADGASVAATATAANATLVLVQERLSEAAAVHAVVTEAALPLDQRTLFSQVDLEQDPSLAPGATAAQIQRLHLLVLGDEVAQDGEEVQAAQALLAELISIEGDVALAWAGLLSALMRDPDFVLY